MIVVERASEEDLPAMIEMAALAADEAQREALVRAVLDRAALVARQGSLRLGFALIDRAFFQHHLVTRLFVHPQHTHPDQPWGAVAGALLAYIEKTCPQPLLFCAVPRSDALFTALLDTRGYVPAGHVDGLPAGPLLFYRRTLVV